MKRILTLFAIAALCFTLSAQTTNDTTSVERQINIEKEYTPEIKEVKRRDIEYNIEDFRVRPSNLEYSNYVLPLIPKTPFTPLEAEKQNLFRLKADKAGFAELAFGFNFNWKAEAYYKILNTRDDRLDIHLDHWGTYWNLKKSDPKAYIRTGLGLDYEHDFGSEHRLTAGLTYRNRYYSYYGADSLLWDSLPSLGMQKFQCRHTFDVNVGARSLKSMRGWDYSARLDYRMENLQYIRQTEHNISLAAAGMKSFGKHQIELDLTLDGAIYSGVEHSNNLIVGLAPYYNVDLKWMDLHAGFRMDFATVRGRVFNIMPDIRAAFHIHRMVRLNVDITGDYRTNTLSRLLDINPYFVFTDTLQNTYTPADFRLGLTVTPVAGLTLNVNAQYAIERNAVQFSNLLLNDTLTRYFRADYVNAQHLSIGFTGNYILKDRYTFLADFRWNKWFTKDDVPAMLYRPAIELHLGVGVMPIKGLNITADYYLATGRQALNPLDGSLIGMTDMHDLNIGVSYLIRNIVTVYAQANNVLSSVPSLRWQSWQGYDNMGFNMAFGLRLKF